MSVLLSNEQFIDLYTYLISDERFGPGPGQGKVGCNHTLHYTIEWMRVHQIQGIRANIEKIADLGGHCDCEVLLNVDPETWEEARDEEITGPDHIGESEWQQFLSDLLSRSGYHKGEKV